MRLPVVVLLTDSLTRCYRLRQAGKSYYEDMINTRHHGGKTWIAPKQAIREDVRASVLLTSLLLSPSLSPSFSYPTDVASRKPSSFPTSPASPY